MKLFILFFFILSTVYGQRAEIKKLGQTSDKPLFTIDFDQKIEGSNLKINADFKNLEGQVVLAEKAIINSTTAEIEDYKIINNQTRENGFVKVEDKTIKIKYEAEGKAFVEKEIKKPENLVAPANFDKWLEVHFEKLKKDKVMHIQFLVWDRFETIGFKVTYLGEGELNGQKVQKFKMNIDNMILAIFITPIRIWKSQDMKQLIRYEGRVAVKQVKGLGLENLDAEVVYFHDLKAAQ